MKKSPKPSVSTNLNKTPAKSPSNSKKSKDSTPRSSTPKESISNISNDPLSFVIRPDIRQRQLALGKALLSIGALRKLGIGNNEEIEIKLKSGVTYTTIAISSNSVTDDTTVAMYPDYRQSIGAQYGDTVTIQKASKYIIESEELFINFIGDAETANSELVGIYLHFADLVFPGLRMPVDEFQIEIWPIDTTKKFSEMHITNPKVVRKPSDLMSTRYTEETKIIMHQVTSFTPRERSYGRIGGVNKAIEVLKTKLELPLYKPDLFRRFGMTPDRGFLLHGPPGTGKTMLLKAVAFETNVMVFNITAGMISSKYFGETEQSLSRIFQEAKKYQPSIILIDEIDSLVPKRDSDDSGEAENRLVSRFLTLMDEIDANDEIAVIGSTNRLHNIDPALRRAGRFGQEIEIGIPDANGRLEILNIQLKNIPNKLNQSFINEIAASTHGYVGADLYALCRDAVNRAIRRGIARGEAPESMFVYQSDVEEALVDIRPSAMKEIALETPKVLWDDIGGLEDVKQRLKETVEWPLNHADSFKRLGISPPRGVLLYGPPGCSKTLIAKALATEAKLNFLAVKGPELFNKYVGESERAVREVFRKARAASPSIIFFDEIDALSTARGADGADTAADRVLTSLLNEMDGIETLNDVIVLAATNLPDMIDKALLRPGRLDRLIYVGPPDKEARLKILGIQAKKMSISEEVDFMSIAESTEGCSGAEIVALCQEAGLNALNENIDETEIRTRHFENALKKLRKAITRDMIEYFEEFAAGSR